MTLSGRVDAHQHFWRPARGDYGWLTPDLTPLYRDFSPADLLPLMRAAGIDTTVLVQAAPTLAETEYLLDLARDHDFIGGVVGWVDLTAADAPATLERLARSRAFKGVRPMLQDLSDPAWISRAPTDAAVHALSRLGLRFDALVRSVHLPHLLAFAQRHPALPIVIDHAAKPDLARGEYEAWRAPLARLAALPQVWCKLSGLVTEAGAGWSTDTLRRHVDAVLELFGPQRVIWGSDWPVVTLAASYGEWVAATDRLVASLSDSQRAAVLGDNARRFYRLDAGA
jgi:L-fuconolactonase